jgi:hypothetical protein
MVVSRLRTKMYRGRDAMAALIVGIASALPRVLHREPGGQISGLSPRDVFFVHGHAFSSVTVPRSW